MLEKQRHQLILDILDECRFASVRNLSTQLDSSEATIRRDINKLFKREKLKKIRGGAESANTSGLNHRQRQLMSSDFVVDKEKHADQKRRIASKAVSICSDDESIIINGGTSTYMMGEFLASRQLSILTNSFVLAQYLTDHGENQVTLPGGEIYRKQGIVVSAYENDTIQYYHSSKMFMGTPGINLVGVTESDPLLIRAEQKLFKQADKLIVLADSSKIGAQSNFIFCPLEDVDMLITDDEADPEMLDKISRKGVEVVIAD